MTEEKFKDRGVNVVLRVFEAEGRWSGVYMLNPSDEHFVAQGAQHSCATYEECIASTRERAKDAVSTFLMQE